MSRKVISFLCFAFSLAILWAYLGQHCFAERLPLTSAVDSKITIQVFEGNDLTPSRIRLYGPGSNAKPRLHQVCEGSLMLAVPPGHYRLVVEKGPEYRRIEKGFEVQSEQPLELGIGIERFTDLSLEGWWSGETHVHLDPDEVALHLAAEDLHVAPLLTMWNDSNKEGFENLAANPVVEVEPTRIYSVLNYEQEPPDIGGSAALYFNLGERVEYDENMVAGLLQAKKLGAWAEIEKPYIWDTPALLATGQVDLIEIAPNTLSWWLKDDFETFEEIEWGRPRDRAAYPGLRGWGLYIQDLYYRILNSGFRIPPSAGTACGVGSQVPVGLGYNRVYVYLGDNFSYSRWWEGLAAGRSFVSNGPLLVARANGKPPGEVFRSHEQLRLDLNVLGNDPVKTLEIVHNGSIVRRIQGPDLRGEHQLEPLQLDESGWFLVRVFADVPADTLSFATTAPFYLDLGTGSKKIRPYDVEYLLRWADVRCRMLSERYQDDPKTDYYLAPHREAHDFYSALLEESPKIAMEPQERTSKVILRGPKGIGDLLLWVPEGIASDRGFSAVYPLGKSWSRQRDAWIQEVSGEGIYGRPSNFKRIDKETFECASIRVPVESPVEWRTELRSSATDVNFRIELRNVGDEPIHKAGAAICLKFMGFDWWSDNNVYVIAHGELCTLGQFGRQAGLPRFSAFQAYLLEGRTYGNPFYIDFWGFNKNRLERPTMISYNPAADLSVSISGEAAYFLHSNSGNPCTDIMLAFGDLGPGASGQVAGKIMIRSGSPRELLNLVD